MKRPFAALGFSVYAGLMLAAWAGPEAARWLIWLCLGAAACGLAAWKVWKKANGLAGAFAVRAPLFAVSCLAAALALGLYVRQWDTAFAPAQQWAGAKARIQAQVLDYPEERYSRYYYRLRVERIEKERVRPFTVRLSAGRRVYVLLLQLYNRRAILPAELPAGRRRRIGGLFVRHGRPPGARPAGTLLEAVLPASAQDKQRLPALAAPGRGLVPVRHGAGPAGRPA